MQEKTSSFTAVLPAVLRAAHQVLDGSPKILADPVAVGFVDGSSEREIQANAEGLRGHFMTRARATFVLRSRFAEDCLAEAAGRVGQCVILGAGHDTFAYRQLAWAKRLRIFEVDHPATQQWKRERLTHLGIPLPQNLVFAPVDFERSSLAEGLEKAGFDLNVPAFFTWLGVTQYLSEPAIDQTFAYVASLPSPSQIAFTFVLPDDAVGPEEKKWAELSANISASRGEPWITRHEPRAWSDRLRRLGFSQVFHLAPADAEARYLRGRTDGLPTPRLEQLMLATV
jgi:methyltransferase (TIGR00027 family)